MKKIFTLIISLQMIASSVFAQQTPTATDSAGTTIGKQTWQTKNLAITTFHDAYGTPIKLAQTAEEWATAARSKVPAYCYYSVLPEIEKLEKSKAEILANAAKIKSSQTFQFDNQAELTLLEEKFEAQKEKAAKSKNSKKELAAIAAKYKIEVEPLLNVKKEHEMAFTKDLESQYTKATDGLDEIKGKIASLTKLEAELGKGSKYGYLYNYWAVMDPRFAPWGYKVPSVKDWDELKAFIKTEPGVALKSSTGWFEVKNGKDYIGYGTDLYNFNGLPGGWRNNSTSEFMNLNDFAYWWTSDKVASANSAYARGLDCTKKDIWEDSNPFAGGLSVRLIQMSPKEIENRQKEIDKQKAPKK